MKAYKKIDDTHVDIGYFGDKKTEDGEYTVVGIAAVHEYGTKPGTVPPIPERSFLRSTTDAKENEWRKSINSKIDKVVAGKTDMVTGLAAFGELAAGDVREKITTGPFKELKESTKAKKGSTRPLIDTGTMRRYCRARVVIGGSVKKETKEGS